MALKPVSIRRKGQITLPAEIRHDLGLEEGDQLLISRRGKEIVLISIEEVEDPSAGMLAEYAYARNPDPAEERTWVARHISETADNYE